MFRQLRDLFRRTEPVEESLELSFDSLPAWLDGREAETENGLLVATEPSREAVRVALESLRDLVARMETAEGAEELPPRLRDVSKKALPGFTKSMAQLLAREPSGDPEAFYTTAAEILKNVIRAVKGQGKYLSALYPNEMKEVRAAVRDLGREVNTMTEAIARARADRQKVGTAREAYASLVRIRGEYPAASARVQAHGTALEDAERGIEETEENLAALRARPDYARLQETDERIRDLDAASEEAGRELAALRASAVHVFRKAEKVAARTKDAGAAAAIGRALNACTGSLTDGREDPAGLTGAAMPAILSMIGRGDLVLKNQDEVRFFSDPGTLPAAMRRALDREQEIAGRRAALQESRAALPAVVEEERLAARLSEVRREREAAAAAKSRAESQQQALQASYAAECERLRSAAAAIAGRSVEVEVPDLLPRSS
ncbi:hypothetical protein F8E02_11375 [Methanoculleus sp. Wushi-C6]|uniref:Uncharacterized protein n=1 Tax=Methanoculleus caldifontis TaxID=2651577 RepID=A0ABU3X3H1_9EURY|nr:hypothetical protein [Methanoculleus sp. Wushi-C6]MDV2482591.1 hypothetical protein [Methanoculleus sp. Wushi-C6]